MDATGVPRAELIAALRRGAAGYLPAVAAIELLIGQGACPPLTTDERDGPAS